MMIKIRKGLDLPITGAPAQRFPAAACSSDTLRAATSPRR